MPTRFSWLSVLLCVVLISCQNKGRNAGSQPSPVPSPVQAPPDQNKDPGSGPLRLTGEAKGLEEPHSYEIQLDWQVSNREPSTFFIVKRNDWASGRVVQGEQGFYQDEEVQEGKDYLYQVQMINGSKSVTSDWLQVTVPKDKVFEGDEIVQTGSVENYARLFLKNKVRIVWQGDKLEIRTHEIISEDAVLDSFSTDQKKAETGEAGRSGGELIIQAKTLKGSLFIRADGQNGGVGLEGSQGGAGEVGTVGPKTFLHWGEPTKFPLGAYNFRGSWFYCDPPRPPGTIGGTGGQGLIGFAGGAGGNSSKVLIEIEDTKSGDLFFTNKPGVGGEGGLGGVGGEGGEGGWSGEIDWKTYASDMPQGADLSLFVACQPKQGEKGPRGSRGPQGGKGNDGFQAPFCLKLGSSQMGYCP
ncbi:MAG: hypothetical protein EBQ92_13400 [Proteobacteria bacterium]|nr:hypothetical protein [Pseudomonadota bacterium]